MARQKYPTAGLLEGIANSKRNIQSLEKAIEKEKQTIRDYKSHIQANEEAEKCKVVVDVEYDPPEGAKVLNPKTSTQVEDTSKDE